jgi:Tol biopolymer transport system component
VLSLSDGFGIILFDSPEHDWGPAWSPDGAQIAFGSWRDGQPQLYVVNVDGSSLTRLTFNARFAGGPAWFPDGSRIAFNARWRAATGISARSMLMVRVSSG